MPAVSISEAATPHRVAQPDEPLCADRASGWIAAPVPVRLKKEPSPDNNNTMISYDDFKKLDIRVGRILSAEKIPGTNKLLVMKIDFGAETRQIVAGIGAVYVPDHIIGKEIPALLNIEPRRIQGVDSHGMILAVDVAGRPVLLHPDSAVPAGSTVR